MKIKIQQCLHGYSQGHQLLGTSFDVPIEARRLLLFQSDLSGSNMQHGFENYITAYPILGSQLYALAKTWYADEIARPGCVWTHTLLIEFKDLGKIAELKSLTGFFQRPQNSNFKDYEYPIDYSNDLSQLSVKRSGKYNAIANALYQKPNHTIFLESENSTDFLDDIFDIWSDQWPRLRRNFTFCTGALGLKILGEKEFDLQVLPVKGSQAVFRSSRSPYLISDSDVQNTEWLSAIHRTPKKVLRGFLWSFGADVAGERSRFPVLISLFNKLSVENGKLNTLNASIKEALPAVNEGRSFKQYIFGERKEQSDFSEFEILNFLTHEKELGHLNIQDYRITERLLNYIESNPKQIDAVIDLLITAERHRFDSTIWRYVPIPENRIEKVLENDAVDSNFVLNNIQQHLNEVSFWRINSSAQLKAVNWLYENKGEDIDSDVLSSIILSKSKVIFEVEKLFGKKVVYLSYDLLNKDAEILEDWYHRICFYHDYEFKDWILSNSKNINQKILHSIFIQHQPSWVVNLPLNLEGWSIMFIKLKNLFNKEQQDYCKCLFLSKGLSMKEQENQWLVSWTFEDVYILAKKSSLHKNWSIIPKDTEILDEEPFSFNPFETLLNFWAKKKYVDDWDYCEILVRTLCNKFVKNRWSFQAFAETLKSEETFSRAVEYLLSSKKGTVFLSGMRNESIKGGLKTSKMQSDFFKKFGL